MESIRGMKECLPICLLDSALFENDEFLKNEISERRNLKIKNVLKTRKTFSAKILQKFKFFSVEQFFKKKSLK